MKTLALIVLAAFAVSAAESGAAERFRPATPDYVVLRVPARAQNDPIVVLEQQHEKAPADQRTAAELAALYVERAREQREARYFGRAEMLLQPWVSSADASAATLRVQADILQNRHDFAGATVLLDAAIGHEPRDAGARLMRASVKVVQGHAAEARADCAAVLGTGATAAGTVCLAQVLSATGKLSQAEVLLKTVLPREAASPESVSYPRVASVQTPTAGAVGAQLAPSQTFSSQILGWAFWLQADCADRRGDVRAAEQYLRASLAATPTNEGVRAALSDLLIARGALHEALRVVDLPAPSTGLLERRARAQQLLGDPGLSATRAQIDDLLTLASRRGERPHLREEALLALDVDGDAERALELAKANFAIQRETIDARLLVRAAKAHGDRDAIETVARWMRETGFQDRALAEIRT